MSAAGNVRRALNYYKDGPVALDGDYTRSDLVQALQDLKFDQATGTQAIILDCDVRDALVRALQQNR
jgi:hypothetical protein